MDNCGDGNLGCLLSQDILLHGMLEPGAAGGNHVGSAVDFPEDLFTDIGLAAVMGCFEPVQLQAVVVPFQGKDAPQQQVRVDISSEQNPLAAEFRQECNTRPIGFGSVFLEGGRRVARKPTPDTARPMISLTGAWFM